MVRTGGNIVVEEITIGDIHYEFDFNAGLKCQVITIPSRDENKNWTWESKNLKSGKIIHYYVNEDHPHYAPKLYNYEAYQVDTWI